MTGRCRDKMLPLLIGLLMILPVSVLSGQHGTAPAVDESEKISSLFLSSRLQ